MRSAMAWLWIAAVQYQKDLDASLVEQQLARDEAAAAAFQRDAVEAQREREAGEARQFRREVADACQRRGVAFLEQKEYDDAIAELYDALRLGREDVTPGTLEPSRVLSLGVAENGNAPSRGDGRDGHDDARDWRAGLAIRHDAPEQLRAQGVQRNEHHGHQREWGKTRGRQHRSISRQAP